MVSVCHPFACMSVVVIWAAVCMRILLALTVKCKCSRAPDISQIKTAGKISVNSAVYKIEQRQLFHR